MPPSIRNFIEALDDPEGLTRTLGEIETDKERYHVGNSAVVFKIRTGKRNPETGIFERRGTKMLKCYLRPMQHLEPIYGSGFLREELYVWDADGRGTWCDVVVDDWIEGVTLHKAIEDAIRNHDMAQLRSLARQFNNLALELLHAEWAHGDLKPENIMVANVARATGRSPEEADSSASRRLATQDSRAPGVGELQLIDLDGKFLPEFAGMPSPELGTRAWQHPARTAADFDASIDDYSIALISTTLHALALDPSLGQKEASIEKPLPAAAILPLFERAGDAVHYRIARLLASPVLRLPELKSLIEYATRSDGDEPNGCATASSEFSAQNGLWGFPELNIPSIYNEAFDFTEGLAAVKTGRTWHFIDTSGRVAIDCSEYDAVKPFANGKATAVKGEKRCEIKHP